VSGLFQSGLLVLLGFVLLLGSGLFLVQKYELVIPGIVHFVSPFHYDASGVDARNLDDEYFTLRNLYKDAVDMSGWTLTNREGVTFAFPEGFVLPSQAKVCVFTGCGVDTDSDLHWCSERPIWRNEGDTATLRDATGRIIDRHTYHRQCKVCGS
jgi:hypothetical protein